MLKKLKPKKQQSMLKKILKWILRAVGAIVIIFILWSLIPLKQTITPMHPRPDTKYWTMQHRYKIAYTRVLPKRDISEGQNTLNLEQQLPSGMLIFVVGDRKFKVLKE